VRELIKVRPLKRGLTTRKKVIMKLIITFLLIFFFSITCCFAGTINEKILNSDGCYGESLYAIPNNTKWKKVVIKYLIICLINKDPKDVYNEEDPAIKISRKKNKLRLSPYIRKHKYGLVFKYKF
jgi:hypothetical protein